MIKLDNVSIQFPIRGDGSYSFRRTLYEKFFAKNENVAKQPQPALINVSLQFGSGERVGLVGKNGAGKTSFLRVLSGAYPPQKGKIKIDGTVSAMMDITAGMDSELSGYDNIFLKGLFMGHSYSFMSKYLEDILGFSELGDRIFDPIKTYSSGMQMRLAFAVVTSIKADIVIMDEWLSVGDHNFSKKSETRLYEMLKFTNIIVLASHSRQLLERICTKIVWLENGVVYRVGSPGDILDEFFD